MTYEPATAPNPATALPDWSTRYHEYNGSYRVDFDPETDVVSDVVVDLVSYGSGHSSTDLPLLYHAIDPDALDGLFTRRLSAAAPFAVTVAFSYAGYLVTVSGRGHVHLTPNSE